MNTESQNKQILAHLQSGKSITAIEALGLCGCFRLSARIYDLRKRGYAIQQEMITINDKRIAKYSLSHCE